MAEFSEVIKEFKRMCRYYNNKATQNDCPLYCKGHGCNISHCRMLAFDDKRFHSMVMSWAAEHPEPVYPTWKEWLAEQGILSAGGLWEKAFKPIPADIAKKLGIKPKGE